MPLRMHMRLNGQATTLLTVFFDSATQCTWKSYNVFSGAKGHINNPDDTDKKDAGPIPKGRYYVIDRPTGGVRDWIRGTVVDFDGRGEWFALFRIDNSIDDKTTINGVTRGNFRLHPGSRSAGCVTFVKKDQFTEVRNLLLAADTELIPSTAKKYYAILTVD